VKTVAALYVIPDGPYAARPGVEIWDEARDARLYAGPHPVVAHPPCERWGRYWFGGPSCKVRKDMGDDGGCFESALAAVEEWGGVLEHPEGSHAWRAFGIAAPPRSGGWVKAGLFRSGWTCCVEQGCYGHRARKATWLYAVTAGRPPELKWGKAPGDFTRLDDGYHSAAERQAKYKAGRRPSRTGACQLLSHRERKLTPTVFAEQLIAIARGAKP
jgi:hypothetical protein